MTVVDDGEGDLDAEDSVRQAYEAYRRLVTQIAGLVGDLAEAEDAVIVAGLGYAVRRGPDEPGPVDPAPAASGGPDDVWPRMTSVTNDGTELYGLLVRCRECDPELYASPDAGASWQRRTMPPEPIGAAHPRTASLVSPAPGLVAWNERRILS